MSAEEQSKAAAARASADRGVDLALDVVNAVRQEEEMAWEMAAAEGVAASPVAASPAALSAAPPLSALGRVGPLVSLVQDRDLAAALSSAMQQQPPYLFLRVRMMHERGGERHREKRFCREFGYEANYGSLGISGGGGLSLHRAGSGLPPLLEELAERGANAANPQALHRTSGQERKEAERRAEKREEAERVRSSRRLNG